MIPTLQLGQFGRRLKLASGGGAPSIDPYFANVVSLCHFGGVDGSTTITDQIPGTSWTVTGESHIESDDSLFGGTSLHLDGTGDRIDSNAIIALAMGTGDFTWEIAFKRPTGNWSGQSNFFGYSNSAATIYQAGSSTLRFFASGADRITGGTLGSGWHAIAYSRNSGTGRLFLDGALIGSWTDSQNYTSNVMRVETGTLSGGSHAVQYFDELRITKGVGRYTAAYTIDTSAFPDS